MKVLKSYQTNGGKELQLFICPTTAHLKFQFGSGGEIPQVLSGYYTSEYVADLAAKTYLSNKEVKVKEIIKEEIVEEATIKTKKGK